MDLSIHFRENTENEISATCFVFSKNNILEILEITNVNIIANREIFNYKIIFY